MSSLARSFDPLYRPGELAYTSGVYRAVHKGGHREDHDVIVLRGEVFPHCRSCRDTVRFELLEEINHVMHDWDFTGPNLQLVHSRK